jgi:hypothetical protein
MYKPGEAAACYLPKMLIVDALRVILLIIIFSPFRL